MSTLFFKSPPHVTAAEMSGNLPSTDALFEASTANEFSQLASSAPHLQTQIRSLKDFITLFSGDDWKGREAGEFASIGLEHLIMLMFGSLPYAFINSTFLLIYHSIPFHHIRIAHKPPHIVNTSSTLESNSSLERALASPLLQRYIFERVLGWLHKIRSRALVAGSKYSRGCAKR
jgi:hypothetical protein